VLLVALKILKCRITETLRIALSNTLKATQVMAMYVTNLTFALWLFVPYVIKPMTGHVRGETQTRT
jgi:hypothetical protein